MMKRWLIVLLLAIVVSSVHAQDEEAADLAYVELNSNFTVPDLAQWDTTVAGETVLFSDDESQALIYVSVHATLNVDEAIVTAISEVDGLSTAPEAALYEGRIGRSNGTWEIRLFEDGDTNITAYALLQSGQVYTVLFAESNPDYAVYHVAVRGAPDEDNPGLIVDLASRTALESVFGEAFEEPARDTALPNPQNPRWIVATYAEDTRTAAYLYPLEDIVYVTLGTADGDQLAELSDAFDTVFLGFVITPDNSEFLILGLGLSAAVMLALLGSMWLRYRNVQKDLAMLDEIQDGT